MQDRKVICWKIFSTTSNFILVSCTIPWWILLQNLCLVKPLTFFHYVMFRWRFRFDICYGKTGGAMFLFNKLLRVPEHSCLYWKGAKETKSSLFSLFSYVLLLHYGTWPRALCTRILYGHDQFSSFMVMISLVPLWSWSVYFSKLVFLVFGCQRT